MISKIFSQLTQPHPNPLLSRRGGEHGFTLVETLIYSIFIIMAIGLFADFGIRISDLRNKIKVMRSVSVAASTVLDVSTDEILQSAEIIEPLAKATSTRLIFRRIIGGEIIEIANIDGTVYLTEDGMSPVKMTSDDVVVTDLVYENMTTNTKRASVVARVTVDYRYDTGGIYDYSMELETAVGQR